MAIWHTFSLGPDHVGDTRYFRRGCSSRNGKIGDTDARVSSRMNYSPSSSGLSGFDLDSIVIRRKLPQISCLRNRGRQMDAEQRVSAISAKLRADWT